MEKTNFFRLSAVPFNTAVEAFQHTPGESPLCQAKWINNVRIPQILTLGVNIQIKAKKKQKVH